MTKTENPFRGMTRDERELSFLLVDFAGYLPVAHMIDAVYNDPQHMLNMPQFQNAPEEFKRRLQRFTWLVTRYIERFKTNPALMSLIQSRDENPPTEAEREEFLRLLNQAAAEAREQKD